MANQHTNKKCSELLRNSVNFKIKIPSDILELSKGWGITTSPENIPDWIADFGFNTNWICGRQCGAHTDDRWSDFWFLNLVIQGDHTVEIYHWRKNGKRELNSDYIPAGKGDIFLLDPRVPHSLYYNEYTIAPKPWICLQLEIPREQIKIVDSIVDSILTQTENKKIKY